jgi:hypothetical protein
MIEGDHSIKEGGNVAYSLVQTSIIETILGNDDKGKTDDDDIR